MHLYHFAMKRFWVKYFEKSPPTSLNQCPVTYYFAQRWCFPNQLKIQLLVLLLLFSISGFSQDFIKIVKEGHNSYAAHNYKRALELFNQAIELDPDAKVLNLTRGTIKGDCEDFRGAIQDLNIAIRIDPLYTEAYYIRAVEKYSIDDYSGALKDLKIAIELNP